MTRTHAMPFGASVLDTGGVRFALWAPGVEQIVLELGSDAVALSMARTADGWHRLDLANARAGDRYCFLLPNGLRVPDPASRFNPDDVHGASQVIDQQAYAWRDGAWHGRPWEESVTYELHVGTFTREGTFETDGYYADYAESPVAQFGLALAQGFIHQGQPSRFRGGAPRGEPGTHVPLAAFISFLQTHDQIGNRALGEHIDSLGNPALVRAARACVLLSPHAPMLFMGEEFAASTPFQYFCDFEPELARAVSQGRREEFGRFAAFASADAQRLAWFGVLNSLSMTLLKFTSPGVPDMYQGHEVINLSLLRDGDYLPLEIHGGHAAHVVAFARRHQGATPVVIAGRLFARLLGELTLAPLGPAVWADTAVAIDVPDGVRLTDVFTGKTLIVRHGRIAVGAAFLHLPVAALMSYSG